MRHGHIAIDLLLPAACALTIDGAFSKRMGILQKEVKALRQQVVYEETAMCQSLFLRPSICISFIKSIFLKKLRREHWEIACKKVSCNEDVYKVGFTTFVTSFW